MMKRFFISLLFIWLGFFAYGQLQGSFKVAKDGRLYFYLYNPTSYQIQVTWGVSNFSTNEKRIFSGVMTPYNTFIYGPNAGWTWMKDEVFMLIYPDGRSVHWKCPQNDSSINYNPSFRGTPSRTGHCRDCGVNHYGRYKCEHFSPMSGHPATCGRCGCPIRSHSYN